MTRQTKFRWAMLVVLSVLIGAIAPAIAQTKKTTTKATGAKNYPYAHMKAAHAAEDLARDYNNQGFGLYSKGDYIGAVVSYDEAIRLDPKSSAAYCGRGSSYCQLGKKKEALDDYNKAIELDANFPLHFYYRGELKLEMGDKEGAKHDFEEAVRIDPGHKDALTALKRLTDKEDAAKADSK